MQQRIAVQDGPQGLIVVKRATDVHRAARLRHEAQVLERYQHPGLVEVLAIEQRGDATCMETRYVGDLTLADFQPTSGIQVTSVLAGVATTIADLHEAGVVHGRLRADHVLVAPNGRPVLCSLGFAGSSDATDGPAPLDDIRALADLGTSLQGRLTAPLGRKARAQHAKAMAVLDDLASSVQSEEPGDVPTARKVAQQLAGVGNVEDTEMELATATAAQSLPGPAQGTRTWRDRVQPPSSTAGKGPAASAAGALVAVVAAFLVGMFVTGGLDRFQQQPTSMEMAGVPQVAGAEAPIETDSAVACVAGGRLCENADPSCDLTATGSPPSRFDIDGDGCRDEVQIEGNLVLAHGHWFSAGEAGDELVLGDWDCNGSDTVALLRVRTGEVFVFNTWANGGAPVDVQSVSVHPGAQAIVGRPLADGCDNLVVSSDQQPEVVITAKDLS